MCVCVCVCVRALIDRHMCKQAFTLILVLNAFDSFSRLAMLSWAASSCFSNSCSRWLFMTTGFPTQIARTSERLALSTCHKNECCLERVSRRSKTKRQVLSGQFKLWYCLFSGARQIYGATFYPGSTWDTFISQPGFSAMKSITTINVAVSVNSGPLQ